MVISENSLHSERVKSMKFNPCKQKNMHEVANYYYYYYLDRRQSRISTEFEKTIQHM